MATTKNSTNIEKVIETDKPILSPFCNDDEDFYFASSHGEILKQSKDGQLKPEFNMGGSPNGIILDKEGKNIYIADLGQQAIFTKLMDDKGGDLTQMVKDFENEPFLGPNRIIISEDSRTLFFTDSGPMGESNLENLKGSVFQIDCLDNIIRPLALNCLAYPSGLAIDEYDDSKIIYVCETMKNRIIRFYLGDGGKTIFNVFYQFSGKVGPIDITIQNNTKNLFVARYELSQISNEGEISILNNKGDFLNKILLPSFPEINGICFSKKKDDIIYVTDQSNKYTCLRILVNQDNIEKSKDKLHNFETYK